MYTTYNTEVIILFVLYCNKLDLCVFGHIIACTGYSRALSVVNRNTELLTLPFGDMHSPGVAEQHDGTTQHEQRRDRRVVCNKPSRHEGSHYPHFIHKGSCTADDLRLNMWHSLRAGGATGSGGIKSQIILELVPTFPPYHRTGTAAVRVQFRWQKSCF